MATSGSENNKVEFRLPSGVLVEELEQRAKAAGVSRNLYARDLLVALLQDSFRMETMDELRKLRDELQGLRQDIAATLETVLLNLANREVEEVSEHVSKILRR